MAPEIRPPTARSVFVIVCSCSKTPLFFCTNVRNSGSLTTKSSNTVPFECAGAFNATPTHARCSGVTDAPSSMESNTTPEVLVTSCIFTSDDARGRAAGGAGTLFRAISMRRRLNKSERPQISSKLLYPSAARMTRTSSATNKKKFSMCSGVPGNFLRSSAFCVATPTGHRFTWQTLAIMHPSAIMTIVPNPNSSAPIIAPTTMSQPVRSPPSTRITTRSRKLFVTRVC
mmetsp:Transcript_32382/g.63748  ORF Transcript_32382/g.63748 Transcript_32382/m.63748 type:complete len:229 (-) Transcript_32382:1131-1817(-)